MQYIVGKSFKLAGTFEFGKLSWIINKYSSFKFDIEDLFMKLL